MRDSVYHAAMLPKRGRAPTAPEEASGPLSVEMRDLVDLVAERLAEEFVAAMKATAPAPAPAAADGGAPIAKPRKKRTRSA